MIDPGNAARAPRVRRLASLTRALIAAAVVTCGRVQSQTVSLRDVVTSNALVGRRVRVIGRCPSPAAGRALDRPARMRDAWLLEADGVAVFVTGPPPRVCSTSGASALTIIAVVAEDTLPAIADLPPAPRRYLLLVDAQVE